MRIINLRFEGIRNLIANTIHPHPHINLIVGENGSGKTSLLEAIYYLSVGKSFRESQSQLVIQKHAESFLVFMVLEHNQVTKNLGIQKKRQGRLAIRINGERIQNLSELAMHLPVQLIHPESQQLVDGGPSYKRRYMDWGVFHKEECFSQVWREFQRVLKQRNAALHHKQPDDMIQLWDTPLAEAGLEVNRMRKNYLAELRPYVQSFLEQLMGQWEIRMMFSEGWDERLEFPEALRQSLSKDKKLLYTSCGPQRADLRFTVDGVELEKWCSRGQQKLVASALLFAQQQYLKDCGKDSVLLVDDLPAELDIINRAKFLDLVKSNVCQTFITATSEKLIPPNYADKVFHVKHGLVETRES